MAEIVLDEAKAKDLVREVLLEMLQDRQSDVYALLVEAVEEAALARAIREGRRGEYVAEDEVQALLKS